MTARAVDGTMAGTMKRLCEYLTASLVVLGTLVLASPAGAATSSNSPLVHVELVSDVASVQPGAPFWVALRQRIPPGWHTYWANPGDSGEPTRLEWTLPSGVTAREISWPAPERIPLGPAVSYGYSGEVLLPVRIDPPAELRPGDTLTLHAAAAWLVCEKECIPEEGAVELTLPVAAGRPAPDRRWGDTMARTLAALPRPSPWPVTVSATATTITLTVAATGLQPARIQDAWFYPLEWGLITYAAPQALAVSPQNLTLSAARGPLADAVTRPVEGVLVITERLDAGPVRQAFVVRAPAPAAAAAAAWSWPTLLAAMALALLGGLVLNLMPCVLPVLSVKALSLVAHGSRGPAVMRRHGLAYTSGVLICFAIVAGGLIGFRAAGEQVGWGFQLQSPLFVTLLAYVLFVMALALSGAVTIGGDVTGVGSTLAVRSGYTGSFFTGALATLVATPCTAPFMATAVGYALTQPGPVALVVFEALGLGLALPYLALSLAPGWARLLPRPGPWMQRLQQVLAFPMYATVAWLVWVLSLQVGPAGLAACLAGLVLVGLGVWLYETTRHSVGGARGIRAVAALSVLIAVSLPALGDPPSPRVAPAERGETGIPWEPYTPERVTELRAGGNAVFVNFTAAWCITCLVNERVALRSSEVTAGFVDKGVAYLKADWTRRDPEIARVLATFDRSGVPLYLLYPANGAGAERPHVLPQILTERIVLEALQRL
ncbi:MAG TPA: protein-disulfide reductase DsbD domain-containing protein [Methylomirabilota bacterium]|nr:protein-disulfide reductase DsbD domain-containing protein [Methylomirabilota bacterium]